MAHESPSRETNLLLMGKSGHGKSSTGNSILGHNFFKSRGGGKSVTKTYQSGYTREDNGRVVKVVDIPGVCDTDCKTEESKIQLVIDAIEEGLKQFPEGFDAMLLVLSYIARMTDGEHEAIKALKLILGENVISDHTVIVMTFGEGFENDHGEDALDDGEKMDFETWCHHDQQEIYRYLFEECGWRIVLFDNSKACTKEKKSQQLRELLMQVDKLTERNTIYTVENLNVAVEDREEKKRVSKLLETYSREIGLVKNSIIKILESQDEDKARQISELQCTVSNLLENLKTEGHEKVADLHDELQAISEQLKMIKKELSKHLNPKQFVGIRKNIADLANRAEDKINFKRKSPFNLIHILQAGYVYVVSKIYDWFIKPRKLSIKDK